MSEQPASAVQTAVVTAAILILDRDNDASFCLKIEDMTVHRQNASRRDASCVPGNFRLAQQEEIYVVGGQRVIQRRLDSIAGTYRANDARRHDDRKVGFVLLVGCAAE